MNFEVVLCHWFPTVGPKGNVCAYLDTVMIDVLWFMPVVVTVRNASSTHKVSASWCWDVLRWLNYEEHTRYWFCDFRNLGTGACGVVTGANVHRMDFCLAHDQHYWSKTFEWNACMRLELTDTTVKRTFLVCVSICCWCSVLLTEWWLPHKFADNPCTSIIWMF